MPVINGVCSFSVADDFVHVSIDAAFAEAAWSTQESAVRDLNDQLLQTKCRAILLNLSAVNRTCSGVVAAILRIRNSVVANGGRIVVLAPSEETRRFLHLSGLSRHLAVAQDAADAVHQLGISQRARLFRRETILLEFISPIAAAAAVLLLIAMLLSLSPVVYQPSILFVLFMSALIAGGGGWLAAAREVGAFRILSRLVSATGFVTLITGIGQWSV